MKLLENDLVDLTQLAIDAALAAGELIERFDRNALMLNKKDCGSSFASQVVTEVDVLSQRSIVDILLPSCEKYNLALLAEEGASNADVQSHARHRKEYFWCIDPLDGTLPFTKNSPGYAVSIALVSKAGKPLIGVIYDPREKTLYSAIAGKGAYKNHLPWQIKSTDKNKALSFITDVSFTSHTQYSLTLAHLENISRQLGYQGFEVIDFGGAVMNACWVLEKAPACYFKFPKPSSGGGCLWDFAASACFFAEAGAVAGDIMAKPLDLNRHDSFFMNHHGVLFASDAEIAENVMRLYQALAYAL